MKNQNFLGISKDLLIDIIGQIVRKTPGVDNTKKVNIDIEKKSSNLIVKVEFYPSEDIINIYDLCLRLQSLIHFQMTKHFDMKNINVEVTAL